MGEHTAGPPFPHRQRAGRVPATRQQRRGRQRWQISVFAVSLAGAASRGPAGGAGSRRSPAASREGLGSLDFGSLSLSQLPSPQADRFDGSVAASLSMAALPPPATHNAETISIGEDTVDHTSVSSVSFHVQFVHSIDRGFCI